MDAYVKGKHDDAKKIGKRCNAHRSTVFANTTRN